MCAIFGALVWNASAPGLVAANKVIRHITDASFERGRDGRGFHVHEYPYKGNESIRSERHATVASEWDKDEFFSTVTSSYMLTASMIGNFRAEPTTEWVEKKKKTDQQPYTVGQWTIVHNGTIANDHAIRLAGAMKLKKAHTTSIDSAAIVELLAIDDMIDKSASEVAQYFANKITLLEGSYAILAMHAQHPGLILAACNYRPIWFAAATNGVFFASSRDYFPAFLVPQMLEPYSMWAFAPDVRSRIDPVCYPPVADRRALVVCSGGLDSVVSACQMIDLGYEVNLLHFRYGSRAEGPEVSAMWKIAAHLGTGLIIHHLGTWKPEDSPLLQADSTIAGGEAGAEFAHEWVPARNLVLLATATAIAEANGYDTLVLGNNLEEAGAYPDNEPEFINRFNDMLPFAVGDGRRVHVVMPVGNLMKHEIVALGHQLNAPMHLTWSCYRAGEKHCGTCGPCYMRRTAFKINGLPEVITYEGE